ncbi:MAG: bifunctional proline dehydrogenase/L-glutamate gamma-semialdehyde dehydrogenase PutA, partial [Pseudomonadota bacterium]
KLYGMGDALFNHMNKENPDLKISIYAPVGPHQDLLPYLVRRMLENGANSSFVNQIYNKEIKPEQIAQDVISKISERNDHAHPQIPLPKDIYGQARDNSKGLNFDQKNLIDDIQNRLKQFKNKTYKAMPVLEGQDIHKGTFVSSFNPANGEEVGQVTFSQSTIVDEAFEIAKTGHVQLSNLYAYQRAEILERFAKKIDEHRFEIINLCVKEAGRTILDSDNEVREAIDFCRYYAALGRKDFNENGISLKSPTGETNHYYQKSRGIFVCISPWNFPVAIYIGQMAAALMAGNAVITKPAEQTSLIGYYLIRLLLDSGLPKKAISFLPGDGELGALIVDHQDVSGVAFTGSTEVAKKINQSLANRVGEIPKLIAETGGQNAMIIDSSALTEQVIDDALLSAFGSAGQRCSACRILYVQDDVADKTIEMIRGAMETLIVGDPQNLNTDIGPLIDEEALMHIQKHKSNLDGFGDKIAQVPLTPEQKAKGSFFASCAYEIPNIQFLDKEHFGPVLHVIRFHMKEIDHVIDDINSTGYGLTFGVHSRIQSFIDHIISRIHVGNIYVNKPIIGAVVGVQPFGGRGLSGTGPKAGGPQYLRGFASEKVVSVDTTRAGGNTSLVMLD